MQLNLSAGSLYTLPLPQVAQLAADAGFAGLEVIVNEDFDFCDGSEIVKEVQQILPVSSLHAPFFDINGWGDQILQLEKTVDLAINCGVPLVNFHPPTWLTLDRKFWRWLNRIKDFQAEVGREQVTVTIENMPTDGPLGCACYYLNRTHDLIDFAAKRNLFLTFDTAHLGTCRSNFFTDFHDCYDTGLIRNVHFSDYGNGREHLLPGHGSLPLTRFLDHLRETGYDGSLTLELLPSELPEEIELIHASLEELIAYLRAETRTGETARNLRAV